MAIFLLSYYLCEWWPSNLRFSSQPAIGHSRARIRLYIVPDLHVHSGELEGSELDSPQVWD